MSFVSYPHLILLISGQTFEVTVAQKKFWKLKLDRKWAHMILYIDGNNFYSDCLALICELGYMMEQEINGVFGLLTDIIWHFVFPVYL